MLPGECVGAGGYRCDSDHEPIDLKPEVLQSGGGYYVGYFCPQCGPISRESGYFKKSADAELELQLILATGKSTRS
jgi:hypothetical protein